MHYGERDRAPICDFSFWPETLEAWYEQGLPRSVTRAGADEYFGMDPLFSCVLDAESTALVTPADPSRSVYRGVYVGLMPCRWRPTTTRPGSRRWSPPWPTA